MQQQNGRVRGRSRSPLPRRPPSRAANGDANGSGELNGASRRNGGRSRSPLPRRPASRAANGDANGCGELNGASRRSGNPEGGYRLTGMRRRPASAQGFRAEDRTGVGREELKRAVKQDKSNSDGDTLQVLVRARPANEAELLNENCTTALKVVDECTCTLKDSRVERKADPYVFTFDTILKESTTQAEVFQCAGIPIIDNVLGGYNSTIFAYGQTGAGKTHTMMGELHKKNGQRSEQMGLAPRVLEFLFDKINKAEQEENAKHDDMELSFTVRCSFIEIYNENIMDLLNPKAVNLPVREDGQKGPYVDGLREVLVRNAEQALSFMVEGIDNRKTAETKSNKKSSRSHSIYTCRVERVTKGLDGSIQIRHSRLNLVDLAGSERNRASGAAGEQLKEACHINKSLTTLGRVIRELIECQKNGAGHIPYRDSKLTHLLQESLGGNAKTTIVANVSPSSVCAVETLSTLQFVRNAKYIKNRARVNEDLEKEMKMCEALNKEIQRLKAENDELRNGSVAQEELRVLEEKLEGERQRADKLQAQLESTIENNAALRSEARALKEEANNLRSERDVLRKTMEMLNTQVNEVHETSVIADEKAKQLASAEKETLKDELRHEELEHKNDGEVIEELQVNLTSMGQYLISLREREQDMMHELEIAHDVMEKQQQELERISEELDTTQHAQGEKLSNMRSISEQLALQKDASAGLEAALEYTRSELATLKTEIASKETEIATLREERHGHKKSNEELLAQMKDLSSCLQSVTEARECTREELASLKTEMAKKEAEIAALCDQGCGHQKSNDELLAQVKELSTRLQAVTDMKCKLESINADLRGQVEEVRKRFKESIETVDLREQEIDYLNGLYTDALSKLEAEACYNDQLMADREQLNRAAYIFGNVVDSISDKIHESEIARSPSIAHKIREYEDKKGDDHSGIQPKLSAGHNKLAPGAMNSYGDVFMMQGKLPSNGFGL